MGINEYIQIGNRIKKLRMEKGYSQKKMAELCGISYSTYSNYENNNREPNLKQLEKIAHALEMTTENLIGQTNIDERRTRIVNNYNFHIMRILGEKDELCIKQLIIDENENAEDEELLFKYACEADFNQFRLKRALEEITDCKTYVQNENLGKNLSLPYEILFSLAKLNPTGEELILEEIEKLSKDSRYKTPIKPSDWDPFDF